jgi:uncharacterized cupin superfamily protein
LVSFKIVNTDDCETSGNWRLIRRSLDVRSFGINIVDMPPGVQIPEHDETGRNQEELFYVLTGCPTLIIDGKEHPVCAGTFARVDPVHRRMLNNRGEQPASVLIISAPRSSGYEPMDWA